MDEWKARTVPFDIFRAESKGSVLWIGSAASLAEAKARIQQQSASSAGEFLVVNQKTGSKVFIKPDKTDASASR
jgi:hypothetical protein